MTDDDEYAVATKIDGHYFAVMFDESTKHEAMRTLGRWASDPELPEFNWYEAARMSAKIREVLCSGV